MDVGVVSAVAQTRAAEQIMGWDLSRPKAFLIHREGMDAEHVESLDLEYRRFLVMATTGTGKQLPISGPVDKLWHAHMLFSKDYAEMSRAACGRMIHHAPAVTNEEQATLKPLYFNGTLPLYAEMFEAEPPEHLWPRHQSVCVSSCCNTLGDE